MNRTLACTVSALLLLGGSAGADGAFPDSLSLFLPTERPGEIVLATNFGLVTSEDDGATWHLVCEEEVASYVIAYQMSAPPDRTLYAETAAGLAYSSDRGCSWKLAQGSLAGANVMDAFPDPNDPMSVFAIASSSPDGGSSVSAVFQSTDGGRSFDGPALFTASTTMALTGVEKARSTPQTLYLTLFSYPPLTPLVARSTAGSAFEFIDESAFISSQPYLAAVDPDDARILYLRIRGQGDALAISRDAGATLSLVLPMDGRMSAFLRRASGTILVGSANGTSLRSLDGGLTFAPWPNAPHVRALGERGGVLYVAADDVRDGFAMARSTDEGAHWTPILHFRDIVGPLPCGDLPTKCAAAWATVIALANPGDAGAAPADAGPMPARPGCGCAVGERAEPPPAIHFALVLVGLLTIARMRYRPASRANGRSTTSTGSASRVRGSNRLS